MAPEYVLYVGSRGAYKDFVVALEGFAQVVQDHRNVSLVVVGGGRLTPSEDALIGRWGLRGSVIHRDVSDADLPGVFGGASVFLYPSRYEGFGLPVLEAMACGTPTVLAAASSLPEVGGQAAVYFPPGDCNSLAEQLRRLLGDADLRRAMSAMGRDRAQAFTWRKTAAATADAYRLALGPKRDL